MNSPFPSLMMNGPRHDYQWSPSAAGASSSSSPHSIYSSPPLMSPHCGYDHPNSSTHTALATNVAPMMMNGRSNEDYQMDFIIGCHTPELSGGDNNNGNSSDSNNNNNNGAPNCQPRAYEIYSLLSRDLPYYPEIFSSGGGAAGTAATATTATTNKSNKLVNRPISRTSSSSSIRSSNHSIESTPMIMSSPVLSTSPTITAATASASGGSPSRGIATTAAATAIPTALGGGVSLSRTPTLTGRTSLSPSHEFKVSKDRHKKSPKQKFSKSDDDLLVTLKEQKNMTWKEIAEHFDGRTAGALQVRYCTKLKIRNVKWSPDDEEILRSAVRNYEEQKWFVISQKLGNKYPPSRCREKYEDLKKSRPVHIINHIEPSDMSHDSD